MQAGYQYASGAVHDVRGRIRLVLCMMFAVVSVGIVQGAAADKPQIYQDPPSEPALLGDVNRDGRVDGTDVLVLKMSITKQFAQGYLDYNSMPTNSLEFKIANCYKDEATPVIDGNDALLIKQFIAHKANAMDKGIGEPVYPDPTEPPTQAPTDDLRPESSTSAIPLMFTPR